MTEEHAQEAIQREKKTGIVRLVHATLNTVKGLRWMWRESAFRQEMAAAVPLCLIALYLDIADWEKLTLCLALVQVLMMEMVNTAIELTVDRVGVEDHPLSAAAKDVGSALVGISLLLAAGLWAFILI